jgi:hypothetical protein
MLRTNIFISYRRADTAGHTGRLYDRLNSHFKGQAQIFMDSDSIAPAVRFELRHNYASQYRGRLHGEGGVRH